MWCSADLPWNNWLLVWIFLMLEKARVMTSSPSRGVKLTHCGFLATPVLLDFRLAQRCKRNICSSEMLRCLDWSNIPLWERCTSTDVTTVKNNTFHMLFLFCYLFRLRPKVNKKILPFFLYWFLAWWWLCVKAETCSKMRWIQVCPE